MTVFVHCFNVLLALTDNCLSVLSVIYNLSEVLQIKVDQVSLVVGRWPGIDVLVIRLKSPSVDKSYYKTITTLVVYS